MNAKLSFIFARRSVREYEAEPVLETEVRDLLEAAMAAPSACCKDPWHFVVVRKPEVLARLAEGLPNGKFLAGAPVGIVVCGDLQRAHGGELSYMIQDCSAALENLLLAAEALGLGACWLGVHPREERVAHLSAVLGLPPNVLPIGAVAIGRPKRRAAARTRYRSEAVHTDGW